MFKKFSLFFIIFCFIISFISSFSKNTISGDSNILIYPTNTTKISSYFGYRELFGKQNFHNGIDFPVPPSTPVYAVASGTITYTGFLNGYGHSITMLHNNGTKTLYSHLDEIYKVKVGGSIKQSEVIGYVGPKYLSNGILNGWTTGPHLHFSIFNNQGVAVDPLTFEFKVK